MKPYKTLILFSCFYIFSNIAIAQTQYLGCTYLLERWKINDLTDKVGCPSGEDGLGKSWLVENYSFDLKQGVVSDASITKSYCWGHVDIVSVKLSIQPDQLIFVEKKEGIERVIKIDRKTLKTNHGSQCNLLKISENKI